MSKSAAGKFLKFDVNSCKFWDRIILLKIFTFYCKNNEGKIGPVKVLAISEDYFTKEEFVVFQELHKGTVGIISLEEWSKVVDMSKKQDKSREKERFSRTPIYENQPSLSNENSFINLTPLPNPWYPWRYYYE